MQRRGRPADCVHPLAVQVMAERGIDISRQEPKDVGEIPQAPSVSYLVVVCDTANDKCPRTLSGHINRMFWPFDDPAAFFGSPAATLEKFRAVRDQIEARIKKWLENP